MLCISIHQPWASLIAHGLKTTRVGAQNTRHRGQIGIHACALVGKTNRLALIDPDINNGLKAIGLTPTLMLHKDGFHEDTPFGFVIATAELVDVIELEKASKALRRKQSQFGDYGPGKFLWIFQDARCLTAPVRASGNIVMFKVDLKEKENTPYTITTNGWKQLLLF